MDRPPVNVSDPTHQLHVFAPEVNGLFLGFLTIEDRDPWDHDLSAGGMSIWLRYLGTATVPFLSVRQPANDTH